MKRNFIIRTVIIVILVIALVIGLSYYFIKESGKKYEIEAINQYNYFVLRTNDEFGVIDRTGNIIIEAKYDDVKIPNPEKAIFVCYEGEETKILNEHNEEILTNYNDVLPIQLKNITSDLMYEKSVFKYQENGKFGLISLDGKKITKPIYDSIEGLSYKEGELLIKKDGKYGVINIKGKTLIKNEYDQINVDGYYNMENGYRSAGYIVSNTTNEGYRYGYINNKGKKLLETEYNQLNRVIDINDNENSYIIASKNGRFGTFKNEEQLIPNEYQLIEYDEGNNIFTIAMNKKYGVANIDGKIIVPAEYNQIDITGIYIYAKNEQGTTVYDTFGNQANIDTDIAILNTSNEKYKIRINNKNGTKYGVIGKNGEQIIDEKYTYVEYLYDNYFIASDANSKLGIIDDKDNVKIQFGNDSLQKIDGTDVIETTEASGNVKKLYSRTMEKICELSDSNVEFKGEYIKIFNKDDVKYFDKQGKELKNTEVYPNNTLFATKVDGKWGFANKSGTVVVEPKYDEVTEFNSYGYAAVKQDGKWGAINVNGDITAEIQYVLDDDIEPSFIGKYYQIKYGFGEIYYTNNET